ncbi:hypothetical protein ACFRAE_17450 [Sphingobacterium sp. HJSM2_6]|uniref:hypothetical protein n=1 Tax=Sphingobacterium sp. HJSM2_6 TaxID=3366264 RepID=UPI003BDB12C4
MKAIDKTFYYDILFDFSHLIEIGEYQEAKSKLKHLVSEHIEALLGYSKMDKNDLNFDSIGLDLDVMTNRLMLVQKDYASYFPSVDFKNLDSIQAYYDNQFIEFPDDEDDEEYDEKSILDMMFPNRDEDDEEDYGL